MSQRDKQGCVSVCLQSPVLFSLSIDAMALLESASPFAASGKVNPKFFKFAVCNPC